MPTDYTQLDAAIMAEVALPGRRELPGIYKAVREKIVIGFGPYWSGQQTASSRLQSLRKRGLIAYSPKRGWSIVEPQDGKP